MIKSCFLRGKQCTHKARLRPLSGHRRALWSPATLAPESLYLSHLRPVGGGKNAAVYSPDARRRAGSLRSVYVGKRWHDSLL